MVKDMPSIDYSIIIPSFNAEALLESCVQKIISYFEGAGKTFEIIIVDDGSTDRTWNIANSLMSRLNSVKAIHLDKNRGKGYAVKTGMLASNGKRRLFFDVDCSTDISYLNDAEQKMDEGFDIVIASRSSRDATGAKQVVPQGIIRRWVGTIGNLFIQLFGVWGIWDTQCGFKLFTARAASDLFERSTIDRWAFDVEILLLAKRTSYKIGLIPIEWIDNPKSALQPLDYFVTLLEIISIRSKIWKPAIIIVLVALILRLPAFWTPILDVDEA